MSVRLAREKLCLEAAVTDGLDWAYDLGVL